MKAQLIAFVKAVKALPYKWVIFEDGAIRTAERIPLKCPDFDDIVEICGCPMQALTGMSGDYTLATRNMFPGLETSDTSSIITAADDEPTDEDILDCFITQDEIMLRKLMIAELQPERRVA